MLRTVSLVAMGGTAAVALLTRARRVQRWDDALEETVELHRGRLVPLARFGTLPGENYMHPTIGALISLGVLRRRGGPVARIVVPMASASLGAIVAHHAVKIVYRRRRPALALRRGKIEPAFPSGHTADATAVLGTGAWVLVREEILPARLAIPLASALMLVTGASRVVLGWHWGTDVVGGWLTGLGVAAECARRYEQRRTGLRVRDPANIRNGSRNSTLMTRIS